MGVCNSKVCSAIVCDRGSNCGSLKPSMCGNRSLAYPSGSCKGLRIEGATDTTINQGVGIDLTEDVHAYDGFGNEIPFEVEPETIEKCEVGEHTVKYTAVGEASIMNPTVCGRNELHTSDECSKLDRIERERTITITQADPPTISGVDEVTIDTNTDFGPSEGVSAVDDNGNVVSFEYNGMYDLEASGEIASFETEFAQSAKSLKVSLEPIQEGTPWMDTDVYSEPYKFKASPQLSEEYNAEDNAIVGGTVAWNQLVQNGNFEEASDWISDYATLAFENNILTYTSTMASGSAAVLGKALGTISGHKYLVSGDVKFNNTLPASGVWIGSGGYNGITKTVTELNKWVNISGVFIRDTGGNDRISFYPRTTLWQNGDTCNIRNIVCFDLTAMFGTTIADYIYSLERANAGAGVAWFKKLFPKDYYEYNAGELISVSGLESHDTVGFNQWDEEWEVGTINDETGATVSASDRIRSKNFIPCLPSTNYYFKHPNSAKVMFYDTDETFIGGSTSWDAQKVIATPSNCRYMKFAMAGAYGTTYNNDICINLSWSGYRNGEYEPYEKHSYPLDNSLTLRGIPKLDASNNLYYDGDEYASDGSVTRRYGIVDLGTLNWSYYNNRFDAILSTIKGVVGWNQVGWICSALGKAVVSPNTSDNDKCLGVYNTSLFVRYNSITTVADFKTAMSGVYLVYELATPTTETAQGYTNPQSVEPYGTEEYATTSIVPVGHKTRYMRIAPISGYTEVDTIVSPTTDAEDGTTYTTDLGQTVYGGTLDVVSGELVVDKGYIASYNGETLPSTWISDRDVYASGTTPSIGAEVVYELATPQTIQLTPTEVDLLIGNNNVWSDGDVSVVWSESIPQGEAFKYPIKGTYQITYTAEDECGNKREVTRTIEVA